VSVASRHFQHDSVMPGFFGTTGTPLIVGREFLLSDTKTTPRVAVVTAAFARQAFGDANPIGQVFGYDDKASASDWTIVRRGGRHARQTGVRTDGAADVLHLRAAGEQRGTLFSPRRGSKARWRP